MAFKHPTYASKSKALHSDPASQVIQGVVCFTKGYPDLAKTVSPYYEQQFRRVKTLKAGK